MILSILIPTYNRYQQLNKLLEYLNKHLIEGIEVLVGNDNPDLEINFPFLSTSFLIINNERNLGECENINNLINKSTGKYIFILFDDESLNISIFNLIIKKILIQDYCDCILLKNYSSDLYILNELPYLNYNLLPDNHYYLSSLYKKRVGFMAIFNKDRLRALGGIKSFTNYPIAICSEYILNVEIMKFNRIFIVNSPVIKINFSYESFSVSNKDYMPYLEAYSNFINELDNFLIDFPSSKSKNIKKHYVNILIYRIGILIGRTIRSNNFIFLSKFITKDFIAISKKISAFNSLYSHALYILAIIVGLTPEIIRKFRHLFSRYLNI
jgi:glycosyltransferase involved in cell wall biosynthesis